MVKARAVILKGPGTNCDLETKAACEKAGFAADIVLLRRMLDQPSLLKEYQFLVVPGGFSYGDDLGSGVVFANEVRLRLRDRLLEFIDRGGLVLGICNGFQILVRSALLPDPRASEPTVTLAWNDSGRFEDRWIRMKVVSTRCVFLTESMILELPVAHGEGKFVPRDEQTLALLKDQIALKYVDPEGREAGYPHNPNGSVANVAGICDPTGRVLGLMPHPERFQDLTNHPEWTRRKDLKEPHGMIFFRNAYRAIR